MRLEKPLFSFLLTLFAIASAGADDNVKKSPPVDLYGDPLPEGALMRLGTVRFRHGEQVTCVSWSPDGKTLASASDDNTVRLWDPASGKEIRALAANHSRFLSVAFSPDGLRLASANSDTTVLIWAVSSVPLKSRKLADAELSRLWVDLGSDDAARADRALWTLVAVPERSVPLLKQQLAPAKPDPKLADKLSKLIADLDSEEFTVREKAATELAKLGAPAEPALKKALTANPSLEVRTRIEALLDLLDKNRWPRLPLQTWRALAVLERIGNDDARHLLKGLSEGDPLAPVTQEAAAAIERLQRLKASQGKP
jgi:hypothetical protein